MSDTPTPNPDDVLDGLADMSLEEMMEALLGGAPQPRGSIYIAGKMRNVKEFNFPAFDMAAEILREEGYIVFSPAERDRDNGFDPTPYDGTEDLSALGFSLNHALADDTAWICLEADAVYMLDGWEDSSGARAEKALAEALGLTVLYQTVDRKVRTPAEQFAYELGQAEGYDSGYSEGYGEAEMYGYDVESELEGEISGLHDRIAELEDEIANG